MVRYAACHVPKDVGSKFVALVLCHWNQVMSLDVEPQAMRLRVNHQPLHRLTCTVPVSMASLMRMASLMSWVKTQPCRPYLEVLQCSMAWWWWWWWVVVVGGGDMERGEGLAECPVYKWKGERHVRSAGWRDILIYDLFRVD